MAITKQYQELNDTCSGIVRSSLQPERAQLLAESHIFLHELERWRGAVAPSKEHLLLGIAAREYQYALLALVQGLYRHAFKGCRSRRFTCQPTKWN